MLGTTKGQKKLFFRPQSLEDLIPEDHILVKVNKVLNLSWLEGRVKGLYSEETGRPSIPPEQGMRLMLAGLILSIAGDRRLMREAQVNIAIRWFSCYEIDERLPDHSSLTRIRQRWGEELFREAFMRVLKDCERAGLLSKDTVHIDSTMIRANTSIEKIVEAHLEEVADENGREGGKICSTDPDATLARSSRGEKFEPRYKAHVAVDDKCGVVVDVKVTSGSANDGSELIEQVKRVEENVGARPGRVTADSGYSSAENYRELEGMGIEPFIVFKQEGKRGKCFPIQRFKYDEANGIVRCPAGKILRRSHRNKTGWHYIAKESDCRNCRLRPRCVSKSQKKRKLYIPDGYPARLRAMRRKARRDEVYIEAMKRHKWRVEGRHAEAKVVHGMRRALRRGLANVTIQVVLTVAVMNLKRLAASAFIALCRPFQALPETLNAWCANFLFHRRLSPRPLLPSLLPSPKPQFSP